MNYEQFIAEFESLTGIKLILYKENQMHRRINTLIERKKLNGFDEFINLLKASPSELEAFKHYITINVTEFFRTPEEWKVFEEDALKPLIECRTEPLKVWSCASSTGEEPYSLAMSLAKLTDLDRFKILGTDIDTEVLEKAGKGFYPETSSQTLPEDEKLEFFTKKNNGYQICDEIKRTVEFRQLDLLKFEYPTDLDLIACRNILIYFNDEAKDKMYEQFFKSLAPGGFLFTGKTEQIVYYKKFGYKKLTSFLYQKPYVISEAQKV